MDSDKTDIEMNNKKNKTNNYTNDKTKKKVKGNKKQGKHQVANNPRWTYWLWDGVRNLLNGKIVWWRGKDRMMFGNNIAYWQIDHTTSLLSLNANYTNKATHEMTGSGVGLYSTNQDPDGPRMSSPAATTVITSGPPTTMLKERQSQRPRLIFL